MRKTLVERFKARKQLSALVEVEFLPTSLYAAYAEKELGRIVPKAELTDEQLAAAKEQFHELTFVMRRPSAVEMRAWDFKLLEGDQEQRLARVQAKLIEHFDTAKHTPKEGEALQFHKAEFEELASYMSAMELLETFGAFRKALDADEALAAGNGHSSGAGGETQ
jgi:hypothetical protein